MAPLISWSGYRRTMLVSSLVLAAATLGWSQAAQAVLSVGKVCEVHANKNGTDDSPAILAAVEECGQDGTIVFSNTTYHVERVLDTRGLKNVEIQLKGTLLFGTDFDYWLENSLPLPGYDENGYQNQSSAWFFGGDNITWNGYGYGTVDGNGQAWYDFIAGRNNYPGRPHGITIFATNSVISGVRFVQSQMWTMTIHSSQNLLMQDIYVSSVSSNGNGTINTDGADTLFSDNIHFDRWHVRNGDDSIALKANSTNIKVTNSEFHDGVGIAIGSIGQYDGIIEVAADFRAENNTYYNTLHALFIKTWAGESVGYPPNGGGGGLGYVRNFVVLNSVMYGCRGSPVAFSQCMTMSPEAGDCNTSTMKISGITVSGLTGTMLPSAAWVASLQCSAANPCEEIRLDLDMSMTNGTKADYYACSNTGAIEGFECDGPTCELPSPDGSC
jgi:galacturan 1,4-alpha-galacturonidase